MFNKARDYSQNKSVLLFLSFLLFLSLLLLSTLLHAGINSYRYYADYTGITNTDIATNGTATVVLSDSGLLKTSTDLATWSTIKLDSPYYNRVIWNGSFFCMVGHNLAMTSSDGLNWTKSAGGFFGAYQLIWDGTRFIGTSSWGNVYTSTDCDTWTISHASGDAVTGGLYTIATNGTTYVAAGQNGILMTTTDLQTWQAQTTAITENISSVVWAPQRSEYLAVTTTKKIYTSPDAITWTQDTSLGTNVFQFQDAFWDGTQYVISGQYILYGVPGNWTKVIVGEGNLSATVKIGTTFVAVGARDVLLSATETDLNTWTTLNGDKKDYSFLATYNGTTITIGHYGNVLSSTDNGNTWSPLTNTGLTSFVYGFEVSNTGVWVIVTGGGTDTITSTDNGANWTYHTSSLPISIQGMTYSATLNKFVSFNVNGIYTSTDGVNWNTEAYVPNFAPYYGMWADAISSFIIYGSNGTFSISADGVNWSEQTCPNAMVNSISNGSIASSTNTLLLRCRFDFYTSTDGTTWTPFTNNNVNPGYYTYLHWNNGEWIGFQNALARTSTDLAGYTVVQNHPTSRSTAMSDVLSLGTTTIGVGSLGMLAMLEQLPEIALVDFNPPNNSVAEAASTQDITVNLSNSHTQDVSIQYSVTGGTATESVDYSLSVSPVVIPAGNTSATITVTLLDDTVKEGDETIEITLGEIINGVAGTTTSITVTITDDDNQLPVIAGSQVFSIDENSVSPTVIGTVQASDPDIIDVLTYSIIAGDNGSFTIDANSGQLSVRGGTKAQVFVPIDYETATSHTLTIQVTDGIDTVTGDVTINVNNLNDNGVFISDNDGTLNNVAENALTGTTVGITALGSDADIGTTVTYSLTNNAGGLFAIDTNSGVVTVNGAIDYETATSHTIEITATSSDGSTNTFAATINVTNVNDNGVVVSDGNVAANSVPENATTGIAVGITAQGSDADVGTTISYSLSNNAGGLFAIDAATGVVTVNGVLDYETATSHNIEVTATSSDGSSNTLAATINVTNINDNGVIVSDDNKVADSVPENATPGTSVGVTASGTDADPGTTVTYTLSNDAGGLFAIDAISGVVTVNGTLDAESATSHMIEITATSSDGSSSTLAATINVTNINDNGVTVSDGNTAANSVIENATIGTAVGVTALGSDGDIGTTVSYSLSNDAGGLFVIDSSSGVVTLNGVLDIQVAGSHLIEVTATSSDGDQATFQATINVAQANLYPVIISDLDPTANSVIENAIIGASTGITFAGTDADPGTTVTYALSNDAGGLFTINSTSGVVTVNGTIDYESATSHTIEVTATSSDGSVATQTAVVSVVNLNDNGVVLYVDSFPPIVAEDATIGTDIQSPAQATDADAGTTISYTLTNDAGGVFAINPSTGDITTNALLDYEAVTQYTIEVTATSSDGSAASANLTIGVSDVDDTAPVIDSVSFDESITSYEIPENSAPLDLLIFGASDVDTTFGITDYAIVSGNGGGEFSINAGYLQLVSPLDYESQSSYTLEITASDGVNISAPYAVTFTVINDTTEDTDGDGVPDGMDTTPNDATQATPKLVSGETVVINAPIGTTLSHSRVLAMDDVSLNNSNKPTDVTFDYGVIAFNLNGISVGETKDVTLKFSSDIPSGAKVYKVMPDGYVDFSDHATINYVNSTVTITLVDGGAGDADGVANGVIVDPVALATPIATTEPTPTNPAPTNPAPANSGSSGGGAIGIIQLLFMLMTLVWKHSTATRRFK